MAKGRGREPRGEAYGRRMVGQQAASGLTVRAFCRRGGLRESTFYFRRRELLRRGPVEVQRRDVAGPSATAGFVPVCVMGGGGQPAAQDDDTVESPGRIEAVLSGGHRIRLTGPVDRQVLADVVAVLEAQQVSHGGPALPKSPMGEAITYALNQWQALNVYTTDGDLSIDNNVSERALRRIAVGRNNWELLGSDNGSTTAEVLFSLIATCERHHVNPFDYLRDVLTRIASHPSTRLAGRLPDTWKAQQ